MTVAIRFDDLASAEADLAWINVCSLDDIPPACGVAALLGDLQVALIRPGQGDRVFALSNFDPFSQAFVIARGIVGDRGGRPKIASPIFKQTFDLETGACFEDPLVKLPVYPVRVRDGRVAIGIAP